MPQPAGGGGSVVDVLRERVTAGLYLGYWKPGDRLPSIREIAHDAGVDRKTAAAAYRRLQKEGIVDVRARSGVFASAPPLPSPGPLDQLYRQWLHNTYRGASALGLDTRVMLRLIAAVSEVEQLPVPVVESSPELAAALSEELRQRLRLAAQPLSPAELRPEHPAVAQAALVLTTPFLRTTLSGSTGTAMLVEATLSAEILREVDRRCSKGSCAILVCGDSLHARVTASLRHCGLNGCRVIQVPSNGGAGDLRGLVPADADVILWPGTPSWVDSQLATRSSYRPKRCLSDETIDRIQSALLGAALRRTRGLGIEATPTPPEARRTHGAPRHLVAQQVQ